VRLNAAVKMSPAMAAASIEHRLWEIGDIVNLIESLEVGDLA
jgi:hypothetical protein